MKVGVVVGNLIATRKCEALVGSKFLEVQLMERGELVHSYIVAVDTVGAGIGDTVLLTGGGSARHAFHSQELPCDTAIVGIVDDIQK